MTKKAKQSKKATRNSKRTKSPGQLDEEADTATTSTPADPPQATPAIPETEVARETQQAVAVPAATAPATPATPEANVAVESRQEIAIAPATESEAPPKSTRSEAAKANIKEGLRLHQIAGRPSRQQLTLVFGEKGYLPTWPKRTERFGITPETFQAALAKGGPAVPLTPVAKPTVEKTKETA